MDEDRINRDLATLDKRVAVLEIQIKSCDEHVTATMGKIDKIFNMLGDHIDDESRTKIKLLGAAFAAAISALGGAIMLLFTQVFHHAA